MEMEKIKEMEIEEAFKSPFKLVFRCPPYFSPLKLPGPRFFLSNRKNQNLHNNRKNI